MLFKELAQNNFVFVERDKSLDSIARLGITLRQAKQEIMELTYEDYCRGPVTDRDRGGQLWEFGKRICGEEMFIRLKVVPEYGMAKCQSFHVAERPLEYPYRGGGNEQGSLP
ncbi:MAG: hypothetical protein HY665_08630 [Chloroflexi bacterium]|nr:hypothetical protein [Chloroflexota bacterium]